VLGLNVGKGLGRRELNHQAEQQESQDTHSCEDGQSMAANPSIKRQKTNQYQ
jgi:hypothetical protein